MKREDPTQPLYDADLRAKPMREKAALISYKPGGGSAMEVKMFGDSSVSKQNEGESKSDTLGEGKRDEAREEIEVNEEPERPDFMEISESLKLSEGGGGKSKLVEDEEVNSPVKMMDVTKDPHLEPEGDRFVPEKVMEMQEGGGSGSSRDTDNGRNSGGKRSSEDSNNVDKDQTEEAVEVQVNTLQATQSDKATSSQHPEQAPVLPEQQPKGWFWCQKEII